MTTIHLGYELGTGAPVEIPLKHMAVTGQTQESGKTTTLEALVTRGNLRAVAFVTKRAEGSFHGGRKIPPYFRERADWQFVSSILEATLRERLKFERSWIMRASKGAKSLADVQANVQSLMATSKGLSADVYMTLDEYLKIVVPQIETLPYVDSVKLEPGLNVVDLAGYSMELQALVIRSMLEWVYEREHDTVTIIPEAWEFIPQNRASPVLLAAEQLIRKGAAAHNYMWLDSQDIAGVHKNVLRSVIVWILGVQRENNEVKRMLEHVPSMPKPTVAQVMKLKRGQFYACWSDRVVPVYVQPAWMSADMAEAASRGIADVVIEHVQKKVEDQEVDAVERKGYEDEIAGLRGRLKEVEKVQKDTLDENETLRRSASEHLEAWTTLRDLRRAFSGVVGTGNGKGSAPIDVRALAREVAALLPKSTGGATIVVQAPEALRKSFLAAEVQRVLGYVRSLAKGPRDALLLLDSTGQWLSVAGLCTRLGRATGGGAYAEFSKAMKEMASAGYIERDDKRGLHSTLRKKLEEDLAVYQPSDEDIEQTYASVMSELTEAVKA